MNGAGFMISYRAQLNAPHQVPTSNNILRMGQIMYLLQLERLIVATLVGTLQTWLPEGCTASRLAHTRLGF